MTETEFSKKTRARSLERFARETFDLLVIGGGITGAAVARDATSRGLKVALVEKHDFAWGTSSRSSKLIHGGLRYLENMEFDLVFEALSERAFLLKTVPHLVRPLPFYLPVYRGDAHGMGQVSLGLWLYDLLSLFRTPGFHRRLNPKKLLSDIPFLKSDYLKGGFKYFDASMWDDALAVETLRAASQEGAVIANYVEATEPLFKGDLLTGFKLIDRERSPQDQVGIDLRATRTVVCAGPWTDQVGRSLSPYWKTWLAPSKGVHLVFDWSRIPVPGALVMSHPHDGRISFVIPRKDLGAGVVIVGTTDGPVAANPEEAQVDALDVRYLLDLLKKYFPTLELTERDILSTYVGVRPLMGAQASTGGSEGQSVGPATGGGESLQKLSREHYIGRGPGGAIVVAGGKYTTHRRMAEEIVDVTLKEWVRDVDSGQCETPVPTSLKKSDTHRPLRTSAPADLSEWESQNSRKVPESLISRYASDTQEILKLDAAPIGAGLRTDPPGFPCLEGQLRFAIRHEMVMHLEDFWFRRVPLFLARADHGEPWAGRLAQVWAEEMGLSDADAKREHEELLAQIQKRSLKK